MFKKKTFNNKHKYFNFNKRIFTNSLLNLLSPNELNYTSNGSKDLTHVCDSNNFHMLML